MSSPFRPSAPIRPSGLGDDFWDAAVTAASGGMPDFLLRQRWYPAKDAGRPAVEIAKLLPVNWLKTPSAVAVWHVSPQGGGSFLLLVPIEMQSSRAAGSDATIARFEYGQTAGAVVEACANPDFVRGWLDVQLRAGGHSGGAIRFDAIRTHHPFQLDTATAEIRRSSVEQSNTSFRIAGRAILKLIRKPESGAHPEVEVARYLDEANFTATPSLFGWTEIADPVNGQRFPLSLLQEYVPNEGDGWSWILERLERSVTPGECSARDEIFGWLGVLARRTADMHQAFARDSADAAFCPETVRESDLNNWASAGVQMADRALFAITAHDGLGEIERHLASELIDQRDELLKQAGRIARLRRGFCKTRHHGDFHLGQVLVAGKDAIILDFEGEPLRSLAERRAKHCVLRDVAGIVRSLSYATETVAHSLPHDIAPDHRRHCTAALRQWQTDSGRKFVRDYFAAARGLKSIPADRSDAEDLLQFFVLEKALYEISYELAHRPERVSIPLKGVVSLLRARGRLFP